MITEEHIVAVTPHDEQVQSAWTELLREHWEDSPRLGLHLKAVSEGLDAYSYLQAHSRDDSDTIKNSIISGTVERVQSEEFNIADLFLEVRKLAEVIETCSPGGQADDVSAFGKVVDLRKILDHFFEIVARETSVVYEFVAERGSQGLMFLDGGGNVTYVNRSAQQLLDKPVNTHDSFISVLSNEDQPRFDAMLQSLKADPNDSPQRLRIRQKDEDGKLYNLELEAAHLGNLTDRNAFYLSLSPARILGLEDELLENFYHGVVRVDADKHVCYANAAAKKMIGIHDDNLLPIHVHEFFGDEDERAQVDEELDIRETGKLSRYEIDITQLSGRKVPISVFAIPEMNTLGQYTGSVAFMRNRELESAKEEFNQILLHSSSWKERLEGLCDWLFERIEANMIYIYQYTEDMAHVSPIAVLLNNGEVFVTGRRWYPLTPGLIQWNREPVTKLVEDFPKFLEREDAAYLREDDSVRDLVENQAIRSFMATQIMEDGASKGGISFLSTEYAKFNQDDVDLIERLPLKEFVISALERKNHDETVFQFKLVSELTKCTSFQEIAEKTTSQLAEQYKWDNVAIFDVAEDLDKTVLLHQTQGSDSGYVLPADFAQPVSKGVLGRAVRSMRSVFVGDVDKELDVDEDKKFVRGHENTKSELVIPIFSNLYQPRRIFWLLNIEDGAAEFLLPSEIEELEKIATQIEFIVNRMLDRVTYEHAMKHTSDGVIVTDVRGVIRYANPASCHLLGRQNEDDLIGREIEKLFCDSQLAQNFIDGILADNHKVEFRCAGDSSPITVLLSRLELPIEISDKYYIFKTLESQKRLANLNAIERLVSVTVNQAKTPLSLVQGMLHRLSHGERVLDKAYIDEFVVRSRKLLKKAELSYDRVAYSEPIVSRKHHIETYIHFDSLIKKVSQEVATNMTDVIGLKIAGKPTPITGDRHQVRFVCESLISHLLRNLAQEENIRVELDYGEKDLDIIFDAVTGQQNIQSDEDDHTDWDRVLSEATFGRSAVRQIVEQHGGVFHEPDFDGESGKLGFRLSFPLSERRKEH